LEESTRKWYDVGDKKARVKTSQALREKVKNPHMKKTMNNLKDIEPVDLRMTNRTVEEDMKIQCEKLLTRKHSLGKNDLHDIMNISNFTWNTGVFPIYEGSHKIFKRFDPCSILI